MPETEEIKTMRILLTDKSKDIPISLYDGYLKANVKLNPDGLVSEQYGEELLRSYSCYAKIEKDAVVNRDGYKIREDYMKHELDNNFSKLLPDERERLNSIAEELIKHRGGGAIASETQVASEVVEATQPPPIAPTELPPPATGNLNTEDGSANNSTENSKHN